jgi:hypothetical protein
MAWILLAMLRVSLASRSTAFVFPARASSLLQGGLCKVSSLPRLLSCFAFVLLARCDVMQFEVQHLRMLMMQ